jgi:hypothetical protein
VLMAAFLRDVMGVNCWLLCEEIQMTIFISLQLLWLKLKPMIVGLGF